MSALLLIVLSAVLATAMVIVHVPAWRPFVGVADVFDNARGMAGAVLFALPLTTAVVYALTHGALLPMRLVYLRTLTLFAVVIAVASIAEVVVRRFGRQFPARPGFALLLITNSALPGVALAADERGRGPVYALLVSAIGAIAFAALLLAFTDLYARVRRADVPPAFRNAPLAFVTIGIVALAFMGFTGLVR